MSFVPLCHHSEQQSDSCHRRAYTNCKLVRPRHGHNTTTTNQTTRRKTKTQRTGAVCRRVVPGSNHAAGEGLLVDEVTTVLFGCLGQVVVGVCVCVCGLCCFF